MPVQRGVVDFCLRAFPLGGYVAFPDEVDEKQTYENDDPDLLKNRPVPDRLWVASAGVMVNIVSALLVIIVQVWGCGRVHADTCRQLVEHNWGYS